MKRREFISLLSGAAVSPTAAWSQIGNDVRRVALLLGVMDNSIEQEYVGTFRKELKRLGWTEGRNLAIDLRFATSDPIKIKASAADLMRNPPDVFLALSTLEVQALLDQTRTVPIVFTMVTDAVGAGFAQTVSHPGGSVTGFENFEPSLGSKWVELLRELSPGCARLGVIFDNPNAVYTRRFLGSVEAAASKLSMQITRIELKDATAAAKALEEFGAGVGVLVVLPSQAASSNAELIIAAASRHNLPAVYPLRAFVASRGGLISYGVDENDQFRRAAEYVDRILRGEKAAILPVQAPTKYELVANLRIAKAQGVEFPATILARADEVIDETPS
jgi:putative tryptophan/tyrosine transport system substrate-binding protein